MRNRLLIASALLATGIAYGEHHPKLSPDLENNDPETRVSVIVQYKYAPQQRNIDAAVSKGGRHLGTLHVVNGAVYSVAAKALVDLANDPDVERINLDHPLAATQSITSATAASAAAINTPDYGWMGVLGVTSPSARGGYDGTGIGVAIIDS